MIFEKALECLRTRYKHDIDEIKANLARNKKISDSNDPGYKHKGTCHSSKAPVIAIENCAVGFLPKLDTRDVSDSFRQHDFCVVDNFIPSDDVEWVHAEMLSLQHKNLYEPSEIWVGRDGQSGVHVHKPEVRGDHIMWVCGRHKTRPAEGWFDSAGTQPQEGDKDTVVPCHVEPASHESYKNTFGELSALKRTVQKIDTLVFSFLSWKNGEKSTNEFDFVERSDVLL